MLGLVIGDNDMITGFRLVGVQGAEVSTVEEAKQALDEALLRNDLAVIIISEEYSTQSRIHETINKVRVERRSPLIVEIPASRGKPSQIPMSELISKTLGVKI
jgi:V/A-type H+/Na+-transporting ATPase subunit F